MDSEPLLIQREEPDIKGSGLKAIQTVWESFLMKKLFLKDILLMAKKPEKELKLEETGKYFWGISLKTKGRDMESFIVRNSATKETGKMTNFTALAIGRKTNTLAKKSMSQQPSKTDLLDTLKKAIKTD